MASADHADVLPLLLRQIDRHPQGVLDGVDLANADPSLASHLLSNGILVEEPPLQDVLPDPGSEYDVSRLVWRRQGSRVLAFSPDASSAPEAVDPRELVQYSIDAQRLCSNIRDDNNLLGSGPEILSPKTTLIGWYGDTVRRTPLVLCRCVSDQNVNEIVHMLISRLSSDRPILITPTERILGPDILNSLQERGLQFVAAEYALDKVLPRPFALQLNEWLPPCTIDAGPDVEADLHIEIAGHRALFHGVELPLTSREFKVLVELAKAHQSGRFVGRNELYEKLYPQEGKCDDRVYEEQITDAVSRLRGKLRGVSERLAQTIGNIIENKKKVGYRLSPSLRHVRIR